MKVKNWMSLDPITVTPDTQVTAAHKIMAENRIRRLPVIEHDGSLVGMITLRNIIEASPSAAEALSRHEMNALMDKLKVGHIMAKNPATCTPDDSVMDVMRGGHIKGIGAFPVVEGGKLVGIVTETEIFRAMVHIFGTHEGNSIVILGDVDLENNLGELSRIATIIEKVSVPVEAIFSLPQRSSGGHRVYIRVQTSRPRDVEKALIAGGYKLVQ